MSVVTRRDRSFAPIRPRPAAREGSERQDLDLEAQARALEATGNYRILRRLEARPAIPMSPLPLPQAHLALVVDLETTGLDPTTDEVIELALVPFHFVDSGQVIAVHEPVCQLRQPSRPIPACITELTGIDDAAVEGRVVDEQAIRPLLAGATLVVAHHAGFDRPFLEKLVPDFAALPWACSMTDISWRSEGMRARNLPALAAEYGFFYDAHRAAADCLAVIEILGRPLPRSGSLAMMELAARAAQDTYRIWAVGAPYEARHILKGRGYQWNNGDDGRPRCWFVDLPRSTLDAERRFLAEEIFHSKIDVPVARLSAYERFSRRY